MTGTPDHGGGPAYPLLAAQRSHLMVVLSRAAPHREAVFRNWFCNALGDALAAHPTVLSVRPYQRDAVDITDGEFAPLPMDHLILCELALDGAEAADEALRCVTTACHAPGSATDLAVWLYYPASEKVGRPARVQPSVLTVAFANGLPGSADEFREWYATRHIRHALKVPGLVSGQCFTRTRFQASSRTAAPYEMIAVYEQEVTAEELLNSFASVSAAELAFPSMDWSRFAEASYSPIEIPGRAAGNTMDPG